MMILRNILLAKQTPFMASVFLAAIGWGSTHIIDRVVNTPTVIYEITNTVQGKIDGKYYYRITVNIQNISLNKSFNNTTFYIRKIPDSDVIFIQNEKDKLISKVISHSPVWSGSDVTQNKIVRFDTAGVKFLVPKLPPNGRVDLVAYFQGIGRPVLQVSSNSPMLLSPKSIKTWLVQNEIMIIAGAIIVWFVVIIFLLSWQDAGNNEQKSNG